MPHGNGSTPTIHLTGQEPLIGQPSILGATVVATMKCPCGAHPVTLITQLTKAGWQSLQGVCVLCQTPYHIHSVGADSTGAMTFNLAVGVKPSLPV